MNSKSLLVMHKQHERSIYCFGNDHDHDALYTEGDNINDCKGSNHGREQDNGEYWY